MMETSDSKKLLVSQLEKIYHHSGWSDFQKNKCLFELFTLTLEEATKEVKINFTTLFSRLAYTGTRYQLSAQFLHYCHIFRKAHEKGIIREENEINYASLGLYVCTILMHDIFKVQFPKERLELDKKLTTIFQQDRKKTIGFKRIVEAILFEIDENKKYLHFFDDEDPSTEKLAKYDVHDKNELFNSNVESLKKTFKLPIHINFIDVEITDDGLYIPHGFIIHPDHMVDVTAISECFKEYGAEPFLYLISKFRPAESTTALLIGNLVNIIFDTLISNPDTEFKTILTEMFRSNPLGFAMMDDQSLTELLAKLKEHFNNLKRTVQHDFRDFKIKKDHIFLEPSFYSRDFGIQGRLDLLHEKKEYTGYDIIELKSGKTFKPNVYGINASHYIQTLLYDLLIKSAFEPKTKSFNYILYSKENNTSLRFAPPVKAQQFEAMKLRNDIVAIEQKLQQLNEENNILTYIKPDNFPKLKGFNIKDIENFLSIYSSLQSHEKAYFDHFTAFIARDHALSKTGEHGINKSNGHAALWLENEEEKRERFALLSNLTIVENNSFSEDPYITFARDKNQQALVNFRVGEIGILYPNRKSDFKSVLKNQIFKCTITNITNESVVVKLRNKQYNQTLFEHTEQWNIEQDSLDSGFNTMYKSLFLWAAASTEYRSIFLGISVPSKIKGHKTISFDDNVTPTQQLLLNKIIATKDYFLLWGPPGTGKTSIMLKNLVKYLHDHTTESILLLAYTNRAVDEICDAVISISSDYNDKIIRLGSIVSSGDRFEQNLLDQQLKKINSRQAILSLLGEKRIFISTVSSIINRHEIFSLKEFDTVIIDEASQILEPMLSGLLSRFKRYVLIGDHKQLPAVVMQDSSVSKIHHEKLNNIGIYNARTSLFERLYLQVVSNKWDHAYGILEQQGRMHEKLMEFPNENFYDGKLQLLDLNNRQKAPSYFKIYNNKYLYPRKVFIPTDEDEELNWKTNINEANVCVKVIEDLMNLFELNNKTFTEDSIGIITPYKAQIAMIRKCLDKMPFEVTKKITIDTVERYQGGARDIIIISFCVNKLSQLDTLVSLSHEGVDRKLNVALTRAKEQIILVGNKELLSSNPVYKALLNSYETYGSSTKKNST